MSVLAGRLGETPAPSLVGVLELRAGEDRYTVRLERDRADIQPGAPPHPQSVISLAPGALDELLGGGSGVEAFLNGRLSARRNLALALQLDAIAGRPSARNRYYRTQRIDAGGLSTFFLEAGRGNPVVILHGLGATNASVLPTFWNLAQNHHVIAPDLPGHGESDKPLRAYNARFYARWLASFLDTLELRHVDLIGHSMGGRIALEAGFEMPERLGKLVLLTPSTAFLRNRQYAPLVRLLRAEFAVLPLVVLRRTVLSLIRSLFADPSAVPDAWLQAATDEFMRIFRTMRGRIAFFSALRQIYLDEAYGPDGFWERLPGLPIPALFVWGRRDWLVPPAFARHVRRCLPTTRSVVLDACAHVPQFEQPDLTSRLVNDFLAR